VHIVEWCGDFSHFNVDHPVASCKTGHVVGTVTEEALFCIVLVLHVSLK
jgi:hypothetical protein